MKCARSNIYHTLINHHLTLDCGVISNPFYAAKCTCSNINHQLMNHLLTLDCGDYLNPFPAEMCTFQQISSIRTSLFGKT